MFICLWIYTRCTAWSISSVVTPGFTIMAAMSRTSLASWKKKHTCQNQSGLTGKQTMQSMASPWRQPDVRSVTLHTTLMPSMSSGDRILICDVPFRNCSDSDIPVWRKQRQMIVIIHTSMLSETDELTQIGPCEAAVVSLSIFRHSINLDHGSWIYILLINL